MAEHAQGLSRSLEHTEWGWVSHQAGLELRNLPASASQVLGLKACATMPGPLLLYLLKDLDGIAVEFW